MDQCGLNCITVLYVLNRPLSKLQTRLDETSEQQMNIIKVQHQKFIHQCFQFIIASLHQKSQICKLPNIEHLD